MSNSETKSSKKESSYKITSSGVIKPNSNFHVLCQVQDSEVPSNIKISITGPDFSATKAVEVQPHSSKVVTFGIPSVKGGEYNLTTESVSKLSFQNTTPLEHNKFENIVLIQTDEAAYKPGDFIRFKVLVLDKDTNPAILQGPVNIYINDPAQNRIKQVNDAKFINGVYSGELQLSPFSKLGQYEIVVHVGDYVEQKTFKVDKYVLPKFEVEIHTAKDVWKNDEKIIAVVQAKGTSGKPLEGKATVSIKPKHAFWRQSSIKPIIKTVALEDGNASFEFDIRSFLIPENHYHTTYELSAIVEETLTTLKQSSCTEVNVHRNKCEIQGVNIPSRYVEDVPFNVTVLVKNYDGSPVQDTQNPVVITLSSGYQWGFPDLIPFKIKKYDESKDSKEIQESEESKEDNQKEGLQLPIIKETLLYDENGMATVQFTIPKNENSFYKLTAKYLDVEVNIGFLKKPKSIVDSLFQGKNFYTITSPRTISPNSCFHVVCQVHESKVPSNMKITITGPDFSTTKTVAVHPYSSETVNFEIPNIKLGQYNLAAEGISGIIFKKTTQLEYNKFENIVLIQTDKATYKPGDLVRFRVLVLDKHTKPAKLQGPVSISINDSAENRIKQVNDAKFTKGVYTGELQLSTFPNLGRWKIVVQVGDTFEQKTFEVDKYVLPKFEVKIDTPKDVSKNDGKIKAVVRAIYTYGKPLKGKVTLRIKPKHGFGFQPSIAPLEKTAVLDGRASFEFDIVNDLKFGFSSNVVFGMVCDTIYELSATVEEALTGFKQNGTAEITVHKERYKIQGVNIPTNYIEDVPIDVTVVVKDCDGTPVQDIKNTVVITLSRALQWGLPISFHLKAVQEFQNIIVIGRVLDENGMATVQFTIPKSQNNSYNLTAKYLDVESNIGSLMKVESKSGSFFKLESQTERPSLCKEVSLKVSSSLSLKYFFYQVIGRGDIIKSGKIEVPDDQTQHIFKIKPTFDMVPSCNVLVYYIKDSVIVFDEKRLSFEQQFDNFVKISAPAQAKAGDEVDITVSTKPNSCVGLLGVDQSVLLVNTGNDLSKDEVFKLFDRFDSKAQFEFGHSRVKEPGRNSGLVVLSNADFPIEARKPMFGFGMPSYSSPTLFGGSSSQARFGGVGTGRPAPTFSSGSTVSVPTIAVRKLFLETWLWKFLEDSESGEIKVHSKVPDTITSWVLTGFSVNPESGLGLTNQPRKIQVFQPFFVSTNLPYSVKRGEVIAIPVIVFNYMDEDNEADVTLENPNQDFEFIDQSKEDEGESASDSQRSKRLVIKRDSGVSKSFLIRPKKVGLITLKISAIAPIAGDIVQQVLRVDPEGVTEYVNKAVLLDLKNKNEQTLEISINVPEDVVPDSIFAEVAVVGDLLGPTIKNLDQLVRMPCGCGEQNMVNFVPNILVLKYLTKISKLTDTILTKARRHLEIGYQCELTFKHKDGSYSAFGQRDPSGSTWLTAYVARSFYMAKEFTEIDDKVIKQALEFLAKHQAANGSFPETGRIIDHHQVDKSGKGLSLTAFTLLAFLENKEQMPNYQEVINKGLDYLAGNIDDKTDISSLAIGAYTLQLAKHDQKEAALDKLKSRIKRDGDRQWWAEKEEEKDKDNKWYWRPQSADVEVTSYGMLALLESGAGEDTLPILKWLLSKRNSNGGFASTQDTVVGLQALIKFAERCSTEKADVEISFQDDKGTNGKITVNDDSAILLQTHSLDPAAKHVTITGKGKGATLVQISYKYNLDKCAEFPRFTIKTEVKDSSSPEKLELVVCTSFIPHGGEKVSNMTVMEVSLPSGYVADSDKIQEIEKVDRVKRVETKNNESVIVIYFDDLDSTEICTTVYGYRAHQVAEQKPTPIIVYDYYDNTRQARTFYEIQKTSIKEICDGTEC